MRNLSSVKDDKTLSPVKLQTLSVNNNYVPIELVSEILMKLHVKALCMCKCVSKEWCRTISSPHFVAKNEALLLKKPVLLFLYFEYGDDKERGKNANMQITTMDIHEGRVHNHFINNADFEVAAKDFHVNSVQIVTCHGLVLFIFGTETDKSIGNIYLCNPSNQHFVPIQKKYDYFEVAFSSVSIGYVPSKDEYKLVLLWNDVYGTLPKEESFRHLTCEISTIVKNGSADSWTVVKIIWPFVSEDGCILLEPFSPLCIDGVMYWIVQDTLTDIVSWVLSVDLETGGYEVFTYPNVTKDSTLRASSQMYLRNLKNSLCVVNLLRTPIILEIWALEKLDKYEWRMEHTIDLSNLVECNDPKYEDWYSYNGSYAINIIDEDEENEEILLDVLYESLYYYNLNSRSFRRAEQFNVAQRAAHFIVPGKKRRVCPVLESWSTIGSRSTKSSF